MMPNYIEMDECLFLKITNQQKSIKTLGVSSCLCLMLYGHQSDNTLFIGMHHWSGFAGPNKGAGYSDEDAVHDLVYFLLTEARKQLQLKNKAPLFLDKIYIVGGEKALPSLSGTEQEVRALTDYFLKHCRLLFNMAEPMVFSATHYITSNEQYLDITMTPSQAPTWELLGVANKEETRIRP